VGAEVRRRGGKIYFFPRRMSYLIEMIQKVQHENTGDTWERMKERGEMENL
jgi:hypothetical protein